MADLEIAPEALNKVLETASGRARDRIRALIARHRVRPLPEAARAEIEEILHGYARAAAGRPGAARTAARARQAAPPRRRRARRGRAAVAVTSTLRIRD